MADSDIGDTEAGEMALEAGGEIYEQLKNDAYDKYLEKA
jgi:hypothetical protein